MPNKHATKEKVEKGETLNGFTFVNQLLMESNRRQSNKPTFCIPVLVSDTVTIFIGLTIGIIFVKKRYEGF